MIDFISDLHLQATDPANFAAWRTYMQQTQADAVFILGDLFEVWVGDDAADTLATGDISFEGRCAEVLRQTAAHRAVFFMHGNRDFLVGKRFCDGLGVTWVQDPFVLEFPGERWVLSHGDALCLSDVDYQRFRETVRSDLWQATFLAKPLAERRGIARDLRQQSQAHQLAVTSYADADSEATLALLTGSSASHLIHGHTHKPADHRHGEGLSRHVLSDWDVEASPARAQVLRLTCRQSGPVTMSRIAPSKI